MTADQKAALVGYGLKQLDAPTEGIQSVPDKYDDVYDFGLTIVEVRRFITFSRPRIAADRAHHFLPFTFRDGRCSRAHDRRRGRTRRRWFGTLANAIRVWRRLVWRTR